MIRLTLVVVSCLAWFDGPSGTPGPEPSYERMKAAAGRDAASQVKLALWCEAHGLETQKLRHLAVAVLSDPSNAMARGLMGLVEYGGKWRRPEAVAEAVKADPARADLLAEYAGRRLRAPVKVEPQWKLALWCEAKGLKDEARAHLATVVRLDPNHAEAWKRLGYKKVGNRWMTGEQAKAERAEVEAMKAAEKRWKPFLTKLRDDLKNPRKRADAEKALGDVTDPRAVPWVWSTLAVGDASLQTLAVQVLGQIDAIAASRALTMLALAGKTPEVRRRATETLKRRDPREWAGPLIGLIGDKVKYEVRPVNGPGSRGVLYVEGKQTNVKRYYSPPAMPTIVPRRDQLLTTDAFGSPILVSNYYDFDSGEAWRPEDSHLTHAQAEQRIHDLYDGQVNAFTAAEAVPGIPPAAAAFFANHLTQAQAAETATRKRMLSQLAQWPAGTPANQRTVNAHYPGIYDFQTIVPIGRMMDEVRLAAAVAQQQLAQDVAALDRWNEQVGSINDRVVTLLNDATGQALPAQSKPWRKWFIDQVGYRNDLMTDDEVPTVIEQVPLAYTPQPVGVIHQTTVSHQGLFFRRLSCFGKGTPVQTLTGSRPIESLEIGDLVLTQDTNSGKLGYRPITVVHHNPPSPTYNISLGDDTIVSSHFHRFWVVGRGWVMARDLKEGEPVRTLGGIAKLTKIEPGAVQPVFNLDVADDADFFAGDLAALVHDNTLPDLKQQPFDAPQAVASK